MSSSDKIRVVIADDHTIMRARIKTILAKEPDLLVVGEIVDSTRVENLTPQWRPDVLVLGMTMPDLDILAVTRRLKEQHPLLNILILTAYDDETYVTGLLAAGVAGSLLKEELPETLVTAIRAAARGAAWLSQQTAGWLARRAVMWMIPWERVPLTPRKRETLRLLALGLSNDEIAQRLHLAKSTVANQISAIYGELGLVSRAEAICYAICHRIVEVSEMEKFMMGTMETPKQRDAK